MMSTIVDKIYDTILSRKRENIKINCKEVRLLIHGRKMQFTRTNIRVIMQGREFNQKIDTC